MAEIEGMLAGIESPNKRAKMDSGLSSTNFDESKFARYYRTDAVSSANLSQSTTVVSNAAAYFSFPYSYTTANTLPTYTASTQNENTPAYSYSSSYGYDYTSINGLSSDYPNGTGTAIQFFLWVIVRWTLHLQFSCQIHSICACEKMPDNSCVYHWYFSSISQHPPPRSPDNKLHGFWCEIWSTGAYLVNSSYNVVIDATCSMSNLLNYSYC